MYSRLPSWLLPGIKSRESENTVPERDLSGLQSMEGRQDGGWPRVLYSPSYLVVITLVSGIGIKVYVEAYRNSFHFHQALKGL